MSAAPLPSTHVSPRLSRRRRWWFAGIAMSLGLFAGVAIAELLLRLFGWDYRSPYDFDAQCGVRLRPGFQFVQASEGRARVAINSAGCRDVEASALEIERDEFNRLRFIIHDEDL